MRAGRVRWAVKPRHAEVRAPSGARPQAAVYRDAVRLLPPLLLLTALAGCGSDARETGAQAPERRTEAATTAPSTDPGRASLRLAVLGDSYSNGEAVGAEHAWPTVMAGLLTKDGLETRVVANPSVTGATTAQMLETGLPPIRAARPDVMTVMLGVNDQVQGRTPEEFAADEDRALEAAVEITGSARRVIAVDIPDYSVSPAAAQFGDPAQIASEIDAFNRVVRQAAARRKVRFMSIVDISRRLGAGGISSDGLHPSAEQLEAWADRITPAAREQWESVLDEAP